MKSEEILQKIIESNGVVLQTVVAIEEMSELTKELTKVIRGADNHDAIVEEMADVMIMLEQVKMMFRVEWDELDHMMNVKLKRMEERMKNESL